MASGHWSRADGQQDAGKEDKEDGKTTTHHCTRTHTILDHGEVFRTSKVKKKYGQT